MIIVERLTKSYGRRRVVDDVSFEAPTGAVTAFLGPNGAGKSTTMRIMCGLTPPDSGRCTMAGTAYRDLVSPGRVVGQVLDARSIHSGRTGLETLRLVAATVGAPASTAEALLEAVDLGGAAGRRVGTYSLGMRQRLALALALVGQPRALILDEPFNGLDPEGIHWFRSVLRTFADQGGAVLLSSHLLAEVQGIADRYVVIARGRLVETGTRAEFLGGTGARARVDGPPEDLARALTAAGLEAEVSDDVVLTDAAPVQVGRTALAASLVLTELGSQGVDLEARFLSLTNETVEEPS